MKHLEKCWPLLFGALLACGSADVDLAGDANGSQSGSTGGGGSALPGDGGGGGVAMPGPNAADEVLALLTGRFDSLQQSLTNPQYFNVSLISCAVDAPELGARVLYVEQALASKLQQPYRQRLYVITEGDDIGTEATSRVYSLVAPSSFVGLCDQQSLRTVTAAEATERHGCQVNLTRVDNHFQGSTSDTACKSSLQGASYATSEVQLHGDRIDSWDRGYDANGVQVWGAVSGPYQFDRKTP